MERFGKGLGKSKGKKQEEEFGKQFGKGSVFGRGRLQQDEEEELGLAFGRGRLQQEEEEDEEEETHLTREFGSLKLKPPPIKGFPQLEALGHAAGPSSESAPSGSGGTGRTKRAPISKAMHPPSPRQTTIPASWGAADVPNAALDKISDNMERLTNLVSTIASNSNKATKEITKYLVDLTNNMQATQNTITSELNQIADKINETQAQAHIDDSISVLDQKLAEYVVVIVPPMLAINIKPSWVLGKGLVSGDEAAELLKNVQQVRVIESLTDFVKACGPAEAPQGEDDAQGEDHPPDDEQGNTQPSAKKNITLRE